MRDPSRIRRFSFFSDTTHLPSAECLRRGVRRRSAALRCLMTAGLLAASARRSRPVAPTMAATRAQRGQAAMEAGRFDEAATGLYAELVQAVPGEPGLRLNLGMALAMAGRPREALPHLEAALDRAARPPSRRLLPRCGPHGAGPAGAGGEAPRDLPGRSAREPGRPSDARARRSSRSNATSRRSASTRPSRSRPRRTRGRGSGWDGATRDCPGRRSRSSRPRAPESAYILLMVADGMVAQERDKSAFGLYREALEKRPDRRGPRGPGRDLRARRPPGLGGHRAGEGAGRCPPATAGSVPLECDFAGGSVRGGGRGEPILERPREPLLALPGGRRAGP